MAGPEQDRRTGAGSSAEPVGERPESGQGAVGADPVGPGRRLRVARETAPVAHQPQQFRLPPGPFRIEPEQRARVSRAAKSR